MESQANTITWMHMMDRPAFCVRDGVIVEANRAALGRLVPVGEPIAPLLATGHEEYAAFTDGLLSLTLRIRDTVYPAAVRQFDGYHVFTLEPDNIDAELRALSLAAQKLREPLAGVIATMGRLLPTLQLPEGSPAAKQVAILNRGLCQIQRIIQNMTDAARYSSEAPQLETREIGSVMEELFEHAAMLCDFCGIRLTYTGLNAAAYSLIDSEWLERCVYCILSNALKFIGEGGTIEVRLTQRGNTLYLTIENSCSGIGTENLANIFDRFLRAPTIEDRRQGVGLGMTLVRTFANAHGGAVILKPTEERGLRLTISLPMRQDATLRSPVIRPDYSGGQDPRLIELSESLPYTLYEPNHNP